MFCIWKYCFFEKGFGESFESARGACYLCVCVSMVMGSYLGINETKTQPAHTHTHLFGIWAVVRLHCVFWLASWLRPEKLIPFMKIVENVGSGPRGNGNELRRNRIDNIKLYKHQKWGYIFLLVRFRKSVYLTKQLHSELPQFNRNQFRFLDSLILCFSAISIFLFLSSISSIPFDTFYLTI